MLLYWGMFTIGFGIGAVFTFITFASKKPEDENDFESSYDKDLHLPQERPLQEQSRAHTP